MGSGFVVDQDSASTCGPFSKFAIFYFKDEVLEFSHQVVHSLLEDGDFPCELSFKGKVEIDAVFDEPFKKITYQRLNVQIVNCANLVKNRVEFPCFGMDCIDGQGYFFLQFVNHFEVCIVRVIFILFRNHKVFLRLLLRHDL